MDTKENEDLRCGSCVTAHRTRGDVGACIFGLSKAALMVYKLLAALRVEHDMSIAVSYTLCGIRPVANEV